MPKSRPYTATQLALLDHLLLPWKWKRKPVHTRALWHPVCAIGLLGTMRDSDRSGSQLLKPLAVCVCVVVQLLLPDSSLTNLAIYRSRLSRARRRSLQRTLHSSRDELYVSVRVCCPVSLFVVKGRVERVVNTSKMASLGGLSVQVNAEGWGCDQNLCCFYNCCVRRASTRFHDVCRPTGVPPGLENVPFAPFSKNDQLGKASDWTNSNFPRVQAGAHAP